VPDGSRAGEIPVLDAESIGRYLRGLDPVLLDTDVQAIAREVDYALSRFDRH